MAFIDGLCLDSVSIELDDESLLVFKVILSHNLTICSDLSHLCLFSSTANEEVVCYNSSLRMTTRTNPSEVDLEAHRPPHLVKMRKTTRYDCFLIILFPLITRIQHVST